VFGKWRRDRTQDSSGSEGSDMSGGVWMSSLLSNPHIGNKLGLRRKPFGQDWDPEGRAPPPVGHIVINSLNRYTRGEMVEREELPEAAAVWDEKSFKRAKDIFAVGGFYCVKGKIAEILTQFDLGSGGLIPFPVYKADLKTPYPGEYFILSFGCVKNTIVPDKCEDLTNFLIRKRTGVKIYNLNDLKSDAKVVLSNQAILGPDLWFEESIHEKIFISDALAQELIASGLKDLLRLNKCHVIGDAS